MNMPQLKLKKEERKKRIPLGAQRVKGSVRYKDPKFVYRWMNDLPGRLDMALDGGYTFVRKEGVEIGDTGTKNTNLGSMVSQYAGRDESGQAFNRYLMRIKKEWWDEDQRAKSDEIDNVDRAIRAGKFKRGANPESAYVPKDGIKIT
jgi:hypothetical protein